MGMSPNRVLAITFGLIFIVTGIFGYSATAGVGLFDPHGGFFLDIFEVNVAQNAFHMLSGTALLIAGLARARAAKIANLIVGLLYAIVGLSGIVLAGGPANVFALNLPNGILHVLGAALLLAIGIGADRVDTKALSQLPPPLASDRVEA